MQQQYGGYYPQPMPQKSMLPIGAGIVLIIGGILGLLVGLIVFAWTGIILGTRPTDPTLAENYDRAVATIGVCGAFYFMTFVFALLGAIYCFKRSKWKIALIGAILGTVFPFVGPFVFIAIAPEVATLSVIVGIYGWIFGGGILNLIGLILVGIAKKHFEIEQPIPQPQYQQPPTYQQPQPQYQQPPTYQQPQPQYQQPPTYQQPQPQYQQPPTYQQPQPQYQQPPTYQQPQPQYQPVKVRCGKCGNIMEITTPQRPIEFNCNSCGTKLRLS